MPLEPLNFTILKKVVSPTLLRNQTSIRNQLPHPYCRNTEDLSGLFRSDQAHLSNLVRSVAESINRIQTVRLVHGKQLDASSCFSSGIPR
jgi:hypothetical protein